jgi:hypothetical protein
MSASMTSHAGLLDNIILYVVYHKKVPAHVALA